MGAEAICSVTFGRRRVAGKALLETSELIFRSPELRLKIPFSDIKKLTVNRGKLIVSYDKGTASFHLGLRAPTWADKIRKPKSLLDKLGVKPEHRVCTIKVKDAGFMVDLKLRVPGVAVRLVRDADVIIFGAETQADLSRLRDLRYAIKPDGMIWTVTPKGKGGVREAHVMAAGKAAGLVDVKVAAFSPTHTASKFVIPKAMR
jgi:hypothetical protein